MNLAVAVGAPTLSSTPKAAKGYIISTIQRETPHNKMDQQEVKSTSSTTSRVIQQTSVERTVNNGSRAGVSVDYRGVARIAPSSYQLRFGNRSRSMGYSSITAGGGSGYRSAYKSSASYSGPAFEASVTRVVASDGLELTPSLISTRAEEKAALGGLNDRFVTYIDKVRLLLNHNKVLEAKVRQLEILRTTPSRSGEMYEAELHKLQGELERLTLEKAQLEINLDNCCRDLEDFQARLDREVEMRRDADEEAKSLRRDVDSATLTRVELESKVETLREELDLLRRSADEDIRALSEQLAAMSNTSDVVVDGVQADLSESLRDIRAAYERLTQNNKVEIEQFYKSKIADLNNQLKDDNSSLKATKVEVNESRRQIQTISVEVEGLRTSNSALESQLEEMENRYDSDMHKCQDRIQELELELSRAGDKVAQQLVDYNALLNVKLSLDLEIQTYRRLLESEEDRISVQASSSSAELTRGTGIIKVVEKVVTDNRIGIATTDGQVDGELVDMLNEVVEDRAGSPKSETWSVEPVEVASPVENRESSRKKKDSSSSSSTSTGSGSESESEI